MTNLEANANFMKIRYLKSIWITIPFREFFGQSGRRRRYPEDMALDAAAVTPKTHVV
jgi:hypothetical protein